MRWKAIVSSDQDIYQWHDWFAWYPIKAGSIWVWLELVERKRAPGVVGACDMGGWDYRVLP